MGGTKNSLTRDLQEKLNQDLSSYHVVWVRLQVINSEGCEWIKSHSFSYLFNFLSCMFVSRSFTLWIRCLSHVGILTLVTAGNSWHLSKIFLDLFIEFQFPWLVINSTSRPSCAPSLLQPSVLTFAPVYSSVVSQIGSRLLDLFIHISIKLF